MVGATLEHARDAALRIGQPAGTSQHLPQLKQRVDVVGIAGQQPTQRLLGQFVPSQRELHRRQVDQGRPHFRLQRQRLPEMRFGFAGAPGTQQHRGQCVEGRRQIGLQGKRAAQAPLRIGGTPALVMQTAEIVVRFDEVRLQLDGATQAVLGALQLADCL